MLTYDFKVVYYWLLDLKFIFGLNVYNIWDIFKFSGNQIDFVWFFGYTSICFASWITYLKYTFQF